MRITKRTRSTIRKIVASLGVLGVAAAVAGLGTYGSFTDSTAPVSTGIGTAVLDLALDQPAGAAAIPVSTSNFLPGDSLTGAVLSVKLPYVPRPATAAAAPRTPREAMILRTVLRVRFVIRISDSWARLRGGDAPMTR